MQIARVLRVAAVALLAFGASCIENSPQNFRLNAKVDGAQFDATGVVATVENSVLTIAGSSQQQFLTLRVVMPSAPGTVSLVPDSIAISRGEILGATSSWSTIWGGSGTVTFTKTAGSEIVGTFSFTAGLTPTQTGSATKVVTQGSFSARF